MGNDDPLSWPVSWTVVIPVKLLAMAKSRLSGLADADRGPWLSPWRPTR